MAVRDDLGDWLESALRKLGGEATIPAACREIWRMHRRELEKSGDLFYTWQYDVRWAAHKLRRRRILRNFDQSPRGIWQLIR